MSGSRLAALRPFEEKKDYLDMRVKNGIEQHRKGFHTLHVVDAQGQPIPGARISLKQKSHDFFFGANLFMLGQLADEQRQRDYERAFCHLFNMATLPFYWNGLEPEQGRLRFAADSEPVYRRPPVDLCLDFCDQHGITPKAHCLNYDGWSPDWLPTGTREVKYYLEKRMSELAEYCADRIHGWEVINEVLCSWHKTEFFHDPRVVEWSFETARRYFPNNELIINEAAQKIWDPFCYNRSEYYLLIERALRQGASIDAIGLQYHMFYKEEKEAIKTRGFYDPEQLCAVMDQYADFGLPLQVTEITIPCYHETSFDEDMQAEILKNLYSLWFAHGSMEAIVYWNLSDGGACAGGEDESHNENRFKGGLLHADMTPKASYRVLDDLIHRQWHTEALLTADASGRASVRPFFGRYDLEIAANGRVYTQEIHLSRENQGELTLCPEQK